MKKDKRMGKGLDALLNSKIDLENDKNKIARINLNEIETNPFQPRQYFDQEEILELASSIEKQGLLQPVILRKIAHGYQLVSGERRFRAYHQIKKSHIEAIVKEELSDQDMLEIALIENVQRKNLNIMEVCESYKLLMEKCNLTQMEISERIGKKRSSVANILRLSNLPEEIKEGLRKKLLTLGHAKIILGLENQEQMLKLFELIIQRDLSVKKTDELAKKIKEGQAEPESPKISNFNKSFILAEEKKLSEKIEGRKVKIKLKKDEKGAIKIDFKSLEDLKNILNLLEN